MIDGRIVIQGERIDVPQSGEGTPLA
jgi:hypothetical protein